MDVLVFILVSGLFFWFVAAPAVTFLHELGHGVSATLVTAGRTTIVQGADPPLLRFCLGRLNFRLRPIVGPRHAFFGYVDYDDADVSRLRSIAITAAGPAASLLVGGALLAVALPADGFGARLAWIGATAAAYQFVMSAVPMRYGRFAGLYAGWNSDGLSIVRLLRSSAS
jgi:hypothetical protein